MSFIRDLFWREDECVMQLHPPSDRYVNNHPYCLHLWKPVDGAIPQPPMELEGIKSLGVCVDRDPDEIGLIDELAKSAFKEQQ